MKYELFLLVIFLVGMLVGSFMAMVIINEINLESFVKEVGDTKEKKRKPKIKKARRVKQKTIKKKDNESLIDKKIVNTVPFVELVSAFNGIDDKELLKKQEDAIDEDFECNKLDKVNK